VRDSVVFVLWNVINFTTRRVDAAGEATASTAVESLLVPCV